MLPSELTNTIKQFIVYVHRNEPHFTYIYVYHTNVLNADNIYKNPPPNVISPIIVCHLYFVMGLHPWLCWMMERSQIPSCPRQLHTCTRLMQGWVTSAGCFPPTKILATLVTSTGAKYTARATHVENVIKQAMWVTICTTVDKQLDDGRHQDMHTL